MPPKDLTEKDKFIHRDLTWLSFNERVLEESLDESNPLLERVKFLAIFINNLDEYFMVRVAGIKNLISSEVSRKDAFGYYPQEVYKEIKTTVGELLKKVYDVYLNKISPELIKNEVYIRKYDQLKADQKKFIKEYFETTLYPIITPMAVDPGHPFPLLPSKSLAFALHLSRKGQHFLAIVPIPKNIPRLIRLPNFKNEVNFILVEEVIRQFIKGFFSGYQIDSFSLFRVIRDSEFFIEEEFTPDLLKAIEEEVRNRSRSKAVYVEVQKGCEAELLGMLSDRVPFAVEEVNFIDGDLDLSFLFELVQKADKPNLCFVGHVAKKMEFEDIFERIKQDEFLIHMPFQSFQPTIDFIEAAAKDQNVLAIKMTLYRTNSESAIVKALQEAAKNKKQVTVLVEIKARFDEENNIKWARELEQFGCHVIYGIPGLKVHSKMTLVVRKEEGRIARYVHLSTGNYNENTARLYSDIGFFTSNDDIAKDISDIFNVVTGYSVAAAYKRIVTSPNDMREHFISLIDREIKFQKKYKNGYIMAKMNSLEDPQIIEKLYEASSEGVKIRLLVRGICSLIPGVSGLSENIKVKSIVGRFLEHSRIFLFNNNANPRIFLSSADWMRRNFDKRIELLFEITKEQMKEHLKDVLNLYWKDNCKSRILQSSRKYQRVAVDGEEFNVQEHLISFYSKIK